MQSQIAQAFRLRHQPVAMSWSDHKPENAIQFKEGKWGCILWLAAHAARGKSAACDRRTFGCFGGGVGMGFGNQYLNFPGGQACFCRFLTFSLPLAMFEEMEGHVAGSFLERHTWAKLLKARGQE